MLSNLQQFVNSLAKPKIYLLAGNVLLVFFLIILTNLGILPFKNFGDFVFFAVIGLALALYRPGWAFLFFVGTIMLENISVGPKGFPIDIRPYQFFGAITIVAIAVRYFSGRLNFKLAKLKWFDFVLIIFAIAGFASAMFAAEYGLALKQSIVMLSFVFLYFLVRNFVQTLEDLKKIVPFFLSSSIIVIFYGIWQNVRFVHGFNSFEAMPGRPNASFTEADWLGIFLVLLVAVIYAIIYWIEITNNQETRNKQLPITNYQLPKLYLACLPARQVSCILYLVPVYIILILTVSRSAWLGAGIVTILFLKIILTQGSWRMRNWQWREFLKHAGLVISIGVISLIFVYVFHLTNFQLFNRAQSSASGLQKITIACDNGEINRVPANLIIKNNSELEKYGCWQINLEDIEKEKLAENYVSEIYRQDPNVNIRAKIYQKSWQEIKNQPILGIGWGNIGKILGVDDRGTVLNSSNIFLEVWLGSGIVGLLAFLTILGYISFKSIKGLMGDDFNKKIIGSFIILSFFALIIPNLFNAGIFLGILWVFLAIAMI